MIGLDCDCDSLANGAAPDPDRHAKHIETTQESTDMMVNVRPRLAGLCLLAAGAVLAVSPAAAAPVLLPGGATATTFFLEFKLELEGKSDTRTEAEAKVKWERKEPSPSFKREAKRENKNAAGSALAGPIDFLFQATPASGGVTFGFDPIPALGFAASSIFVPDAELRTLTLMQIEFKIEGRSETIPASGTFGGLLFNGALFAGPVTLTTPPGQDEAELKRFYALPGGDAFSVPFTIAGSLGGDANAKEIEVKIKFGTGTFAAPPPPPVVDVVEPAGLAVLASGLLGLAGAARRRSCTG
jgi:hypothetical protein